MIDSLTLGQLRAMLAEVADLPDSTPVMRNEPVAEGENGETLASTLWLDLPHLQKVVVIDDEEPVDCVMLVLQVEANTFCVAEDASA